MSASIYRTAKDRAFAELAQALVELPLDQQTQFLEKIREQRAENQKLCARGIDPDAGQRIH